jgi:uncharacterized protein
MRETVANTGPLQYLHQFDLLHLLPDFYGRVLVPYAVAVELARGREQGVNVPDLSTLTWVDVRRLPDPLWPLPQEIDRGEAEVLALAAGATEPLVILDDAAARSHAKTLGLKVTGTLGVLLRAKREGKIAELSPLLDRLGQLGFHLAEHTRAEVLRLAGEAA